MDPERYARVLRELNRLRADLDLPAISEIPRGYCGDPWQCPVARALGSSGPATYGGNDISVVTDGWYAGLADDFRPFESYELRGFVRDFDAGRYPELEARR